MTEGSIRLSAEAARFVEDLDPIDLAASVGALLLIPQNLHFWFRLEGVAHLVVAGAARGEHRSSPNRIERLCNNVLAGLVGHLDDSWEQPSTVGFTFHGGTRVVIPGGVDTMFEVRLLARVLAGRADIDAAVRDRGTALLQAVAHLSHTVLSRAGLSRNQRVPPQSSKVYVPSEAALRRLKAAVHFEMQDLCELFEEAGARREDVWALTAEIGNVQLQPGPWESEHLTYRPLARSGSSIVVVAPHLLMQAALRAVVLHAMETQAHEGLAAALHDAAVSLAGQSLERLHHHQSSPAWSSRSPSGHSWISHQLWQFDDDKILHLAVTSDALERCQSVAPIGAWDTADLPEALLEAHANLERTVAQSQPAPRCLLTLVICAGAGRDYAVEKPAKPLGERSALFFLASDLEVIQLAEDEADPLLLWKYACSRDEVARTTQIDAWSALDIYGLWKRRGRRFLNATDPTFSRMSIQPGAGAEELRFAAVQRYDWHAVEHPEGRLVEVGLAEGARPIYRPRQPSRHQFELVVDVHGIAIWIVSPRLQSGDRAGREICVQFGRTVAYWVSEFARALPDAFADLAAHQSLALINFEIGSSEAWLALRSGDGESDGPGFGLRQESARAITLVVEPAFLRRYTASGNTAEGDLAVAVVSALLGLGTNCAKAEAVVRTARAQVVPPGPKRMLHQVDSRRRPELVPTTRMEVRYLQAFDAARVQTTTLGILRSVLGGAEGEWIGDKVQDALKQAVNFHFQQLRRSIATMDASALHYIMGRSDALLADRSRRRDTLASQLACYADDAKVVARLREDLPANAQASLATRFLIELMAAEAPAGTDRVSDALFDEWLAIACEIVSLGTACDVQHLQLAEVKIHLHPNGYAISRGTYGEAAVAVQEASVVQAIETASGPGNSFTPSAWPFPTMAEIDQAAEAEFGCTLTEIDRALGHVSHIAGERNESVVEMPEQAVVSELAGRLSWDEGKVRGVIEMLVLEPRSTFTEPSRPYSSSDVLPWRFNRALSYLRRPLIRVARGEQSHICFGAGAPVAAAEHLIELCMQGRIKARSVELRRLMSRFSEAFGMVFNAQVGETMERNGFLVRANVKKVGRDRLTFEGNDLGDIDVLAIDEYQKAIWVIECKNFAAARVPHEVKHDLEDLFIDRPGKTCVQTKHLRRVSWVEAHVVETLDWLKIPMRGCWKVKTGLAFSQALISPLLGHASMPIWILGELRAGGGPGFAKRPRSGRKHGN